MLDQFVQLSAIDLCLTNGSPAQHSYYKPLKPTNMRILTNITLLALLILIVSCNPAAKPEGKVADIDSLTGLWIKAWNEHDSAAIADMLTEDTQIIFSSNQKLTGSASIMKDWITKNLPLTNKLQSDKLASDATGEMAYYTGAYSREFTWKDSTMMDIGSYTTIWKKQDNKWSLAVMTFGAGPE